MIVLSFSYLSLYEFMLLYEMWAINFKQCIWVVNGRLLLLKILLGCSRSSWCWEFCKVYIVRFLYLNSTEQDRKFSNTPEWLWQSKIISGYNLRLVLYSNYNLSPTHLHPETGQKYCNPHNQVIDASQFYFIYLL